VIGKAEIELGQIVRSRGAAAADVGRAEAVRRRDAPVLEQHKEIARPLHGKQGNP